MTDEEIIKELKEMADIMNTLGDLRKAKILENAIELIRKQKIRIKLLKAPKKCPWCGQLLR